MWRSRSLPLGRRRRPSPCSYRSSRPRRPSWTRSRRQCAGSARLGHPCRWRLTARSLWRGCTCRRCSGRRPRPYLPTRSSRSPSRWPCAAIARWGCWSPPTWSPTCPRKGCICRQYCSSGRECRPRRPSLCSSRRLWRSPWARGPRRWWSRSSRRSWYPPLGGPIPRPCLPPSAKRWPGCCRRTGRGCPVRPESTCLTPLSTRGRSSSSAPL